MRRLNKSHAVLFSVCFAFLVVSLGAFTRLTDAGLGCPDWPGCYQQMLVPMSADAIQQAEQLYPNNPVEPFKAWAEMVHRYVAGTLGLFIAGFFLSAFARRQTPTWERILTSVLLLFVVGQAALGMWTVTLKLWPVVVMGHLLGGFCILSLLWFYYLRLQSPYSIPSRAFSWTFCLTLVAVVVQIALGGWTSSNYAALACPDFPGCSLSFWPNFEWRAFALFRGGDLANPLSVIQYADQVTIQMTHRAWALLASIAVLLTVFHCRKVGLSSFSHLLLVLLATQLALGIANVLWYLPLPVAMLHHGVAALLLLTLIAAWHRYQRG